MNRVDERLVQAWLDAGSDLGIRVVAPYPLPTGNGKEVRCEAFLPDFGSPSGAAVLSPKTERQIRPVVKAMEGLWYSVHGRLDRLAYERSRFVDVLEDWGWFGPAEQKPSWCRSIR